MIALTQRVIVGSFAAVLLACMAAPAAVAAPTGSYSVFAQCPTHTWHVNGCLYALVEAGYISLGKVVVPISKPVVLQGGLLREEEPSLKHLVGALNGETLTSVRQRVPGGLLGLPLEAVAELAAPASSVVLFSGEPLDLTLPVKIRLEPLLGTECLIGSNSHPIEIALTSATSGGLTGNPGEESSLENGTILLKSGVTMVSSGFAVPKVSGCGPAIIDELMDAKLGLPSSNTSAKFNMRMEVANSVRVEASEG